MTAQPEIPYDYFVCTYNRQLWRGRYRLVQHTYSIHCQHAGTALSEEWDWRLRVECNDPDRVAVVWYGQISPPMFLYELPVEVNDEP